MAQQPTNPPLTPAQQDALDALISMKVPKKEAADLISRVKGGDAGTVLSQALRLRGYPGQPPRPPAGAQLKAVQGQPVAPVPPPVTPPPVPQQQIPGYGPPGGPAAAPTANQLQQFLMSRQAYSPSAQTQAPAAGQPSRFWRFLAGTPPPAPVTQRAPMAPPQSPAGPSMQTPPPQAAPQPAMPPPAPVKPRVRVKAVGTKIPEAPTPSELEEAKQASEELPKKQPAELPLISTQEEYDKLPVGTRFKHPDGFIYRKERESSPEQKLAAGGQVQNPDGPQPYEANWEPTYEAAGSTNQASGNTDTVPAELTPGEYVVPKKAVENIGVENLDALSASAQGNTPQDFFSTSLAQGKRPPIDVAAPKGTETQEDLAGKQPATIRYNNPGGMWNGSSSRRFGSTTYGILSDGNHIAKFDTPEQGAAAQFDLLGSRKYINRTVSDVIREWSGETGGAKNVQQYVASLGLAPETVITPELLRSPAGIALAKAQARWETGHAYPMTDQQWQQAQNMAYGGGQ